MIIRKLTDEDCLQREEVSSLSFIHTVDENQEFSLAGRNFLGAFDEKSQLLVSSLQIEDFNVSFCGNIIRCGGIGCVCSRPDFRRSGSVRKLFDTFFEDESYDISVLYPFSTAFYRKFGYVNAGHFVKLEMPYASISFIPRDFRVQLYNGSQANELYAFHNRLAIESDLTFMRNNDRYFKNKPFQLLEYTYLGYHSTGRVNGYVTFRCDRSLSSVFVSDMMYEDKSSLLNLLSFLRTYDGNYNILVFERLPLWSEIFRIIPNTSKEIVRTVRDMGSVRVLNLERMLSMQKYPYEKGHFSIRVDDCIERNNGIFDIRYGDNKVSVEKRESGDYDVRLDAAAVSELVLIGIDGNYHDLSYWSGVDILSENDDLLRAFPRRRIHFTDNF